MLFRSLFLAGCHDHGASPDKVARVRIVDAVPSPTRLDLSVDGHVVVKHVEFGSDSGYTALEPGHHTLGVRSGAMSADVSGELERGLAYTVLAIPIGHGDLGLSVIKESGGASAKDRATLRFVAASPDEPKLSLALNNVIAVDALRFKSESEAVSLRPGDYDMKLWTGNDASQLLGPSTVHLDGGKSYTVVAMGRRVDGSLSLRSYEDK